MRFCTEPPVYSGQFSSTPTEPMRVVPGMICFDAPLA